MAMLYKLIILIYGVGLLCIAGCKGKHHIENLNGNSIEVFGHAGMGIQSTYPMNSAESIQKCLQTEADGSEMDIQMTKDSVLVAYHNEELSENTNFSGMIHNYSISELDPLHYKSTPFRNYKLAVPDNLFSNINIENKRFTFDCKLYTTANIDVFIETYARALARLIKKHHLEKRCYIESQNEKLLLELKRLLPDCNLFIYRSVFSESLEIAQRLQLFGITMSTHLITKAQIEEAHRNTIRVAIWNVQSRKDNKEAVLKNPDIIQSDRPEHLIKIME